MTSVDEAGTHNSSGTIDPTEKVSITFTIKDDGGVDIPASSLESFSVVATGPTSNPNMLLYNSVAPAALGAGPTYTMNLPKLYHYEFIQDATAALETFTTSRTPHWNVAGAETTVYARTATGAGSTLATAATITNNYIDVASAAAFSRDDVIVIEDGVGGKEEYMRIQYVDGNRLWFSSQYTAAYKAGIENAHASGAAVNVVTLTEKTVTTDYTLNATTGVITEVTEFGDTNAVVVSYTSDFVVPTLYPGTLNESPDLDSSYAKWTGLAVVDGTYTLGLHARTTIVHNPFGEATTYRQGSKDGTVNFLFGSATALVANTRIDSSAGCSKCHDDLQFHGGNRRGYETCLLCHGVAGAEDRPQYVAANAPATSKETIDFRTMLHKIHHGKELANAATFNVVGFGFGYPNNFSNHMYDKVGFPSLAGGTKECTSCHGTASTAWQDPAVRTHPLGQPLMSRVWRETCGSCHDSDAATAHIDANTSPFGAESCSICHGEGEEWHVERMHHVR